MRPSRPRSPSSPARQHLQEMDGVLQDTWHPINRKIAVALELDPAEEHRNHVRRVPMFASPLMGDLLHCRLARMHPSALVLDGRSLVELPSPPKHPPGVACAAAASGGAVEPLAYVPGQGYTVLRGYVCRARTRHPNQCSSRSSQCLALPPPAQKP